MAPARILKRSWIEPVQRWGVGALATGVIKGLGYEIGHDVVRGIVQGHHSWPKFMGGPSKQELARLHASIHRSFHKALEVDLRRADFPRVGGRGGGKSDWGRRFKDNPGQRDEAIQILRQVTREFDRKNGTKITYYLDKTLGGRLP